MAGRREYDCLIVAQDLAPIAEDVPDDILCLDPDTCLIDDGRRLKLRLRGQNVQFTKREAWVMWQGFLAGRATEAHLALDQVTAGD